MNESTIDAKGRTTVPAQVRARIGAAAGTKLAWVVLPDGSVVAHALADPPVKAADRSPASRPASRAAR
jgi:bifunctional DNA-binding transcriptional regulator/antitoxin component of YhaV-PrlF toxin-antitoxin module